MSSEIMPGERELLERFRKRLAREKVGVAVRSGRLIKLRCAWFSCDSVQTEAHHPDYTYPLSVIWLCRRHHMAHHGALSRADKYTAYREMFGLDSLG